MTNLVLSFLFTVCLAFGAISAAPVRLLWSADMEGQIVEECGFRIYRAEAVDGTWTVWTNVPAASVQVGGSTNFQLWFELEPGAHFFRATMTNFWGESDFSNIARTPERPGRMALRISK